jgi:hypothetical protein
MGLLQELPDQEQITSVLSGLIGDETSETGIAGVLTLLENLNPSQMLAGLSGSLNSVSFEGGEGADGLTDGLLDGFEQLVQDFPQDPAALIAPLASRLEGLARLVRSDLAGGLGNSIGGLQSLQELLPQDSGTLLSGAAQSIEAVKTEFLSGSLGQLKTWSADLARLDEELAGLASSGVGGLEDALIGYLAAEVEQVAQVILPEQLSPADRLAAQVNEAISAERLTALNTRKEAVIQAVNAARQELQNGNVINTAQLDAAVAAFQALQEDVTGMVTQLGGALEDEASTPNGMAAALRRQYEQFQTIEIVDLGGVRERFNEALQGVREAIEGFSLQEARVELDEVFQGLQEGIGQFDLAALSAKLGELRGQIEAAAGDLDSILLEIVASIRAVFGQLRDGLRSVVSALGEYDENGQFHFTVQQQIEEFLNGIRQTISDTLTPLLTSFKDAVRDALGQVKSLLDGIQAQIDSVKAQLQGALQGVSDRLRELDLPGKVDAIGAQLEAMLSQLGEINFDLVVNPVIAQIEEMRDLLRGIDLSALNDFLREALGVAVEVVLAIDFPGQITDALLAELDKLLQVPKDTLSTIETRVEDALKVVGRLAPDALLSPLDTLFAPVSETLDQLKVEALVEPVAEWYNSVQAEVDRLSPAELLRPVVVAYNSLQQTLGSISPERLTQPLDSTLAGFRADLQRLDFSSVTGEIGGVIESVRARLGGLDPAALLAPLVQAYDTVKAALDGLDPAALLAPLGRLFEKLVGPLGNLSIPAAQRIGEAFGPLAALPGRFDPAQVFAAAGEHWTAARTAAAGLNMGRLLSDLRGPYEALSAALPVGADAALANKVAGLNPLRSEALGAAASRLQQLQPQLERAFAQPQPPGDLVSQFEELRPRLESLIPAWAGGTVTPEAVRAALSEYDPSGVAEEIQAVVDELKIQFAALNPRALQDDLRETFATLDSTLASIQPDAVAAEINRVVQSVTEKLNLLNPQLLVDELQGLSDELQGILAGIDPSSIIAALEELANDVKALIAGLNPAILLNELKEPFEQVRGMLDSFSPAVFREALQVVFTEIQSILEAIDLGKVLKPLVDRIDQLRDELERALRRTEAAFEEMVAAIPL